MPVDRDKIRTRVERRLDRTEPPYLPMRHPVDGEERLTKLTCEEWEEYWQRWKLHRRKFKAYHRRFRWPSPTTAEVVWKLLEGSDKERFDNARLVPNYGWLRPDDKPWLERVAKQAFLIVIDAFVSAGRSGWIVTLNDVFEALARGFSDNFIESPAAVVRDMTVQRVRRCRRDLLVNGVELKRLWDLVRGPWSSQNGRNPLFYREVQPFGGYQVTPRESPELVQYDDFLSKDPEFVRTRRSGFQLLTASGSLPPPKVSRRMCAEQPYNAVEIGEASHGLLALQAEARLVLDVQKFKKDYEAAEQKERELEGMIRSRYDVFPRLSDVRRWIPVDPQKPRGKRFTRTRVVRGQRYVQTWSLREKDLFYRALHEGRQQLGVAGGARRERPVRGALEFERAVREELKTELPKWRETHLENYRDWRDPNRRRRKPLAAEEMLRVITDRSPVSAEQLIRAWLMAAEWRREVREALRDFDRAYSLVITFRWVYEDVRDIEEQNRLFAIGRRQPFSELDHLSIRSGFYRVINRRYQPTHFWPTFVSARDLKPTDPGADSLTEEYFAPYRERWFKVEDRETRNVVSLVGLDISSSQTQILAFLLNDKELEALTKQAFKYVLARRVWDNKKHRALLWKGTRPYVDPDADKEDQRLQELLKTLWMRKLYGSTPTYILDDLKRQPEIYGPTLRPKNAFTILKSWDEYKRLTWFLRACERLVEVALEKDPYGGVEFHDPLDGAKVRWNPVQRTDWHLASEGQRLILNLPGREGDKAREAGNGGPPGYWLTDKFFHYEPDKNGDFLVSLGELENMVAPCLIHVLDAYFSSLVMSKLAACGIHDFVGIHDCWLVPEQVWINGESQDGKAILEQAIQDASREWYRGLQPIYDMLVRYLGEDEEFGADVKKLKEDWEARRKTDDIPTFYAPP